MHRHLLLRLLATTLLMAQVPSLRAQSLADVAAAEARRRQAQTRPAKVYTNEHLAGTLQGAATSSAPAPATGSKSPTTAGPASATKTDATKSETADEKKTEAYWRGRVTALQQGLARNKVLMEAMQSRINALNAEGLSADDPGRQAAIQASLTTAVGEMARLQQESEKQNKELVAIQDEARRANIPPGWLR